MEQEPRGPEKAAEIPKAERLEASTEAGKGPEHAQESEADRNKNVEVARAKIEKSAAETAEPAKENAPKRMSSHLDPKQAYTDTMASIQRHLSSPSKTFSKVIHSPAVEKTSEAVGQTVLRPSVTLGASSTALLVGAFTYWLAKHYGYAISGSTILLSLLVGGVAGLMIEGIAKLFRRRQP